MIIAVGLISAALVFAAEPEKISVPGASMEQSCATALGASARAGRGSEDRGFVGEYSRWILAHSTRDLLPLMLATVQVKAPEALALDLERDGVLGEIFDGLRIRGGGVSGMDGWAGPARLEPGDGGRLVAATRGESVDPFVLERFGLAWSRFAWDHGWDRKHLTRKHIERFALPLTEPMRIEFVPEIAGKLTLVNRMIVAVAVRRFHRQAIHSRAGNEQIMAYHPGVHLPFRIEFTRFSGSGGEGLTISDVTPLPDNNDREFYVRLARQLAQADMFVEAPADDVVVDRAGNHFGRVHVSAPNLLRFRFKLDLNRSQINDLVRSAFGQTLIDNVLTVRRGRWLYYLAFKARGDVFSVIRIWPSTRSRPESDILANPATLR